MQLFSTIFLSLFIGVSEPAPATQGSIQPGLPPPVDNDEVVIDARIPAVRVFSRPKDMRRYEKLVYNVKKVYPIAIEAREMLAEMETTLVQMKSPREQKKYIRRMEQELTDKYTPVLKKMTFSQGKILIKLIDRETERTGYAIVKELRGGFSATLYQGVARIFGANLKDSYDKDGEDQLIEEIIEMIELGLL